MMNAIKRALITVLVGATAVGVVAQQPVQLTVNGHPVYGWPFAHTVNGRALVPLRAVVEDLGGTVAWAEYDRRIDVAFGPTNIVLNVGSDVAKVNGHDVQMDMPMEVFFDSAMVPARFIKDAFGAEVAWIESDALVAISNENAGQQAFTETHMLHATLGVNSVIPVRLGEVLSSATSHVGDTFRAKIVTGGKPSYAGLPADTELEGKVTIARPREGLHAGALQVVFERMIYPDGTKYLIDGSAIWLNEKVKSIEGNVYVARTRSEASMKTPLWVGYGHPAMLVAFDRGPNGAPVGTEEALDHMLNRLDHRYNRPRDVEIARDTEFGVRLNKSMNVH